MKKWIGWVLVIIAVSEITFIRWIGLNMTEGQLFINYWPAWLSVVGLCIMAMALINSND